MFWVAESVVPTVQPLTNDDPPSAQGDFPMTSAQVQHARALRAGVRLEVFTAFWMLLEVTASIGPVPPQPACCSPFGLDSVMELVSGAILLWRLVVEAREGTLHAWNVPSVVRYDWSPSP